MSDSGGGTKIVVGLGNPGAKYQDTRHNVGFEVLQQLAKEHCASPPKSKFDGQTSEIMVADHKLVLVWPLTYMNRSGRCCKAFTDFYKIDVTQDLLVICDDMSLPLGKLRMRARGSAGGQKGLGDILRSCGTQEIARLRLGIDPPPPPWDAADYVLSRFRGEEREVIDEALGIAARAVVDWATRGPGYCMNRING